MHWLTDLAGAEPTPLHGATKFVVKFPPAVFSSLIRSIPVVEDIATLTPTQLNGRFLCDFWPQQLGLCPSGAGGIALMRLVLQAQNVREQRAVSARVRARVRLGLG